MKCVTLILAGLALLLGGGLQVRAEMIVANTFGPGDSYSSNGYTVSGGGFADYTATAAGFIPSLTTTLSRVRFAAEDLSFPGLGVDVLLAKADGHGKPGSTVEALGMVNPSNQVLSTVFTLDSSTHPVLTGGTLYWLILQPDLPGSKLDVAWTISNLPARGPTAGRFIPNGGWDVSNVGPQPAFEILGASVPVASPEPSILVELATAAITGIGYLGWRRRRAGFARHEYPGPFLPRAGQG